MDIVDHHWRISTENLQEIPIIKEFIGEIEGEGETSQISSNKQNSALMIWGFIYLHTE